MSKPAVMARSVRFGKITETIVRSSVGSLWLSLKLSSLGAPKFTMSLRTMNPFMTAAVSLGAGGTIFFHFNPWFFDLSSDRLMRFAVLHELYHVLYDHLTRGVELAEARNEAIKRGRVLFPMNGELWNIAIDCLVNEKLAEQGILTPGVEEDFERTMMLVHQHMFPTVPQPPRRPGEGGVWLLSRVLPGFDEPWGTKLQPLRSLWTSERVYDLLEAMADKIVLVFGSGAVGAPVEATQASEDTDGPKLPPNTRVIYIPPSQEVQDRAKEVAERAQRAAGKAQQGPEMDAAKKLLEADSSPSSPPGASRHDRFETFKIVRPTQNGNRWDRETARIFAHRLFPREGEQWVKPHKMLGAFYPDVLMANEAETDVETKELMIFGDCSGSMTHLIPHLIGIVETMVKRFSSWKHRCRVSVYAHDTEIYDWPDLLRNKGCAPSSGGTAFQPIADFVEGRATTSATEHHAGGTLCPRYPDMVYVVTDGDAYIPTIKIPSRWTWLLVAGPNHMLSPQTPNVGRVVLYK